MSDALAAVFAPEVCAAIEALVEARIEEKLRERNVPAEQTSVAKEERPDDLLTVRQAAQRIGSSEQYIRHLLGVRLTPVKLNMPDRADPRHYPTRVYRGEVEALARERS